MALFVTAQARRAPWRWGGLLLFLLLAPYLLSCGARTAARAYVRPPVQKYPSRTITLPSGLEVIFERDTTLPVVGLAWAVRVGAMADPRDDEGLAHLVEHLAFRSPDAQGFSTYEHLTRLSAANIQGRTTLESTTYEVFIHREAFLDLFRFVTQWMLAPLAGVDEELFARELRVVHEELDFHDPVGTQYEIVMALKKALFTPDHPLTRPLGGTHDSLGRLKLADAKAFVEAHYRAPHMVLVVSGDFELEKIPALLSMLPGPLQGDRSKPVQPAHLSPAAGLPLDRRHAHPLITINAPVPSPEVWIGWALPPATSYAPAPTVLRNLLRTIHPSVMGERVVEGGRIEQIGYGEVSTLVHGGPFGGLLLYRTRLPPGSLGDRAAQEIVEDLSQLWVLMDNDREWFERHRAAAATGFVLNFGDLRGRLSFEASSALYDPQLRFSDVVDRAGAVPYTDVAKVARNYLIEDRARVLIVSPSGRGPRGRAGRPPFEDTTASKEASGDEAVPESRNIADVVHPMGASRALLSRLPNGLDVIVLPREQLPLSSIIMGFHASPSTKETVTVQRAALHAAHSTHKYHANDLGIYRSVTLGNDSLQTSVASMAHDESNALNLLSRALHSVTIEWPSSSFTDRLPLREAQEREPDARVARLFGETLWGKHPYATDPLADEIERVESDRIEAWMNRVLQPKNGVLVVVGDVDPNSVLARARDEFASWNPSAEYSLENAPAPSVRSSGSLQVVTVQRQASAATLRLGCLLPLVKDMGQSVVGELIAALTRQQLFKQLREKTGASYSPHATSSYYRGGAAAMTAVADVDAADLPSAVATIKAMMDPRAPMPFKPEDLERVRWQEGLQSPFRYGSSDALARVLFTYWNMGWSPAMLDEYPRRLAAIRYADIEQAFAVCRANAVLAILGDASVEAASKRN